jgi:tRNA nucleotidyltransferase (CCA-adding enzyme)
VASTNLIQQLSGPRLQNEILVLFAEQDPVRAIARLAKLKLLRFLHRRLCATATVTRVVTAVPKALAWWGRRFPDAVIDRPIVYLMALSSESSPVVIAAIIRRLACSREQATKMSAGGKQVDRVLKRLTDRGTLRPSQVYRILADLPDEARVLLLAKQISRQQGVRLSLLRRYLVAYEKNRVITTVLKGRDLQAMELKPGPQYGTILGKLLDARIDGMITSEAEERALARRLLKRAVPVVREK